MGENQTRPTGGCSGSKCHRCRHCVYRFVVLAVVFFSLVRTNVAAAAEAIRLFLL